MTSEEISRVISNALGPVTSSVDRMASSLVDFKLTTTQHLTEIRSDLRHVCEGHSELVGDVKQLREQWPLVESHMKREEDTQTFKLQQATTKKSDPAGLSIRFPKGSSFAKLAPLILAAAMGLIGLGFYLASGNAADATATVRALRAITDTTTKMSGELKRIQEELDAGEAAR
jgi:hypothetical protein